MAKMQPILKIWYDSLRDDNKILGLKCKRCGAVEFPPVPVCNSCSGMDMEWVEMSGEGELISFGFSPMGIAPYTKTPVMCGYVQLKEGMLFSAQILNATKADEDELLANMPIPIKLEVVAMDDTISYPAIRLLK